MTASDSFFDTNVLLYVVSDNVKKANCAEALLEAGGVVSVQVLNEFAAVAIRERMDMDRLRHALESIRAACAVLPLDVDTHERGLALHERYKYHIYDSMLLASALSAGCSVVYSEDMQHGQR
ncbi:MAG TPA: PIN domain-containing protein, partial [Candidatus Baltobacteraceae bacterium]|nr:PIN domain-containing protein [Candidatus Baltobacteraceae bacterium]